MGVVLQHEQQFLLQPGTQFVDGNALLFSEPVRHRCLRRVEASGAEVVVRAVCGVEGAEQQICVGQGFFPGHGVHGVPLHQQGGDLRIGEQRCAGWVIRKVSGGILLGDTQGHAVFVICGGLCQQLGQRQSFGLKIKSRDGGLRLRGRVVR